MFTHIGLLPGVGPEVGLEVLQARVRFGAALELQRDRNRQTDSERERLPECSVVLVGSWAEKRAGQQRKKKEKALRVSVFKCNLLLEPCPPTVACHTKAKQCYTLVKRAIM